MNGVRVETKDIGGISYELWKTRCGKPNCKRCPHGPYWYKPIRTPRGIKHAYIGKDLEKGIKTKSPDGKALREWEGMPVPGTGRPGRCGCGKVLTEGDATLGWCKRCKSELTLEGLNVPCPNCERRLPGVRLDSDACPTCNFSPLPPVHEDRRQFYTAPAKPALTSPQEESYAGKP